MLAVATLVPGAGTSPGGGGPVVTGGSARTVLLAAAVRAESAPTSGTYWHVRSMSRTTLPQRFGTRRQPLHARAGVGHREMDHARRPDLVGPARVGAAEDPGGRSRVAAGRLTEQVVHGGDGHGAAQAHLPAHRARHGFPDALRQGHIRGDRRTELTLRATPAAAAGRPTRCGPGWSVSPGTTSTRRHPPRWWISTWPNELSDLLVDPPVPPGVRAAAFRALADMPNVKSIGPIRDELGRAGVGIADSDTPGVSHCGPWRRHPGQYPGREAHPHTDHRSGHLARAGRPDEYRQRLRSVSDTLILASRLDERETAQAGAARCSSASRRKIEDVTPALP